MQRGAKGPRERWNFHETYTRMLTRTALLLALCVVVQQFKTVSQFITGPLVNLILLLAALAVGLGSGLCIAVLSPILAFLIAPSPVMQLMPQLIVLVAAGNAALVVCAWALRKQDKFFWLGFLLGAAAKVAVMAGGLQFVLLPLFGGVLNEKQVATVSTMFGVNQFITALIGGVLCAILWPLLRKVKGFVLQKA